MPKPPVEVYPLFAIVAVPLSFACWIMYEKREHIILTLYPHVAYICL